MVKKKTSLEETIMKTLWNSFAAAFSYYSIIPMPKKRFKEKDAKYQLCFLPLIGVVIGAVLNVWNLGWPYLCNYNFLPAVVFVIVPVIVSRGHHVDGFIDTVDAICAPKSREHKLEILKDTHIGSFAIIISLSYFLIALGVWSEMPINGIPILAIGFVLSRALCAFSIVTFPHAHTSKLLNMINGKVQKNVIRVVMIICTCVCATLMYQLEPIYGSCGVLGALISYLYYYYIAKRHFGGITEAVAGFFVQVCELLIPCFVLVAWKFI